MGLYTNPNTMEAAHEIEMELNMDELLEAFYYDDHYSDSDEEKRELYNKVKALVR